MKYLHDYLEDAQTKLFEEYGVIFAFSKTQFNESRQIGVEYVLLDSGMLCPKGNEIDFLNQHETVVEQGISADIEENGKRKIIERELGNYECFYSQDLMPAIGALIDYAQPLGMTKDALKAEIKDIFKEILPTIDY
jgi:hypothetical protein